MVQNNTLKTGLILLMSIIASFVGLLTFLRFIIDRLFNRCCKLQLQAIEEFRPDIVVGMFKFMHYKGDYKNLTLQVKRQRDRIEKFASFCRRSVLSLMCLFTHIL
jgi:hypothetical protein